MPKQLWKCVVLSNQQSKTKYIQFRVILFRLASMAWLFLGTDYRKRPNFASQGAMRSLNLSLTQSNLWRRVSLFPVICGSCNLGNWRKTNACEEKTHHSGSYSDTFHTALPLVSAVSDVMVKEFLSEIPAAYSALPPSFLFSQYPLSSHVSSRKFNTPHPSMPKDRAASAQTIRIPQLVLYCTRLHFFNWHEHSTSCPNSPTEF